MGTKSVVVASQVLVGVGLLVAGCNGSGTTGRTDADLAASVGGSVALQSRVAA